MSTGWTEERRRKQAARIRRTKPWKKATGPKTPGGKARASMNAIKHGERCRKWKEYGKLLQLNADFLRQFKKLRYIDPEIFRKTNELMKRPEKRLENKRIRIRPPAHPRTK